MQHRSSSSWKRLPLALLMIALNSPRALTAPAAAPHGPRIIMIIRHAEKPIDTGGDKSPDLSKQGFARADALANATPYHFAKPDFLIATRKSNSSNRPIETLTPLSKALHEEIESK